MPEVVSIDTAYEDLANAIIVRAVEDYKDLLIKSGSENARYRNRAELMRFFTSSWFEELCAIDRDSFLDEINKLMERYRLTHDVVKERGGTHYYVCSAESHDCILDGPFKSKAKALHRAADMQKLEFHEYIKIRRSAYRYVKSE